MKILLAPDKFKGSLTATEACEAIERGVRRYDQSIEVVHHPLSDGGEGTLYILESVLGLEKVEVEVTDPLQRPIHAFYLRNQQTAYIEMAQASGLQLLGESERDPLKTTTFGTGQLIKHAIESSIREVFLFIGGSATNDAGIGMAAALGYEFVNLEGTIDRWNGETLSDIMGIDQSAVSSLLSNVEFTVLCDVNNPLYGLEGASHVFAAQKGASSEAIEKLDSGLKHLADLMQNNFELIQGAGAAGGLGYGAMTFLNAEIRSGSEFILEETRFAERLESSNLVITGEGKIDAQSLRGKVIAGIHELVEKAQVPITMIAGEVEDRDRIMETWNPLELISLRNDELTKSESMQRAAELLEEAAFQMMKGLAKHFSEK